MERMKVNLQIEAVSMGNKPVSDLAEKIVSEVKRIEKEYNLDCTLSLKIMDYPLVRNSIQ